MSLQLQVLGKMRTTWYCKSQKFTQPSKFVPNFDTRAHWKRSVFVLIREQRPAARGGAGESHLRVMPYVLVRESYVQGR